MPRLRNAHTGTVVDVDDDTAARLGRAYEPVEGQTKSASKKAPATKAAAKPSDD